MSNGHFSLSEMLLALCILLVSACSVSPADTESPRKYKIVCSTPTTRLTVSDNREVLWENGDGVLVFDATNQEASCFYANCAEPSSRADFEGDIEVSSGNYFAIYPASCAENPMEPFYLSLYGNQPYWDSDNLMAAYCDDGSGHFVFENVLSALKFSVQADDVWKVSLRGNGGEAVAGKFEIDYDPVVVGGFEGYTDHYELVIREILEAETEVSNTNTLSFIPGEWYYLYLLPQDFEQGVTITVYQGGGRVSELRLDYPLSFRRNVMKKVSALDTRTTVTEPGVEAIDMGLPSGLKWASCNLGADDFTAKGDSYRWGEITPSTKRTWDEYRWCKGSSKTLTRYCTNANYGYNGFTDGLETLRSGDDAAHIQLKGKWRIPTKADFEELLNEDNCTVRTSVANNYSYTSLIITSKVNGNKIILYSTQAGVAPPPVGGKYTSGTYITSSLMPSNPSKEYVLSFSRGENTANTRNYTFSTVDRCNPYYIRPVCE